MTLDTTKVDVNRTTTGIVLPSEISSEVIAKTQESSFVMANARRMVIPGPGITLDVIETDPKPAWVDETAEKTVSTPTFGSKKIVPYKMAVIVPFSNQFRRDKDTLYNAVIERVPGTLAALFDATAFGFQSAPGSNFDTLSGATAVDIEADTYDNLVTAKTTVSTAGGSATAWVFAPQAESILLMAKDSSGRPIFIDSPTDQGGVGRVLSLPAYYRQAAYNAGSSAANTIGFVGDWNKAVYGIVEDITVEYSNQATINDGSKQINLWQRNMFALRCEMEVGFAVMDEDCFVRLTDTYSKA